MQSSSSPPFGGPKTIYLDTKPVRYLWKLHLGDWKDANIQKRVDAEKLRSAILDLYGANKLRAVTSGLCVMEMLKFARSHAYATARFGLGDDLLDIEYGGSYEKKALDGYPGGTDRLFTEVEQKFNEWIRDDGATLIHMIFDFQNPFISRNEEVPTSAIIRFATYLDFLAGIEAADSIHFAYALWTSDAILSSDKELINAISAISNESWKLLRDRFEVCFGEKLDIEKSDFKAFRYPKQIAELEKWASR